MFEVEFRSGMYEAAPEVGYSLNDSLGTDLPCESQGENGHMVLE